MSVREFLGARYVPVFADPLAWDSTRTYEPLTVVSYQGNSFTSRQYVPTGIDITNNAYWAQTGNYNAQVEAYRQEVQTFDGRIDTLEDELPTNEFDSTNTVKKYVDDNVSEIESIIPSSSFNSTNTVKKYIDDNISNLSSYIDELHHRNFILLSDSFGSGIYPINSTDYGQSDYGWRKYAKSRLTSMGCTVYDNADVVTVGNAGFTSSAPFINTLNSLITDVISDPDEITDIVVIAGTNDSGSNYATIFSAVVTFGERCREVFKNASIRIGCMGTNLAGLKTVRTAYEYGAGRVGGHFIGTLYNLLCLRSYISTDGTHLTESGYSYYKEPIFDAVVNGDCWWTHVIPLEITPPSGYSLSNLSIDAVVTPYQMNFNVRPYAAEGAIAGINASTFSSSIVDLAFTCLNMPRLTQYTTALFKVNVLYNVVINGETYTFNYSGGYGYVLPTSETTITIHVRALPTYIASGAIRYEIEPTTAVLRM